MLKSAKLNQRKLPQLRPMLFYRGSNLQSPLATAVVEVAEIRKGQC